MRIAATIGVFGAWVVVLQCVVMPADGWRSFGVALCVVVCGFFLGRGIAEKRQ